MAPIATIGQDDQPATIGQNYLRPEIESKRPTLVRWTDYLTGRTCTLKIDPSDTGIRLGPLVSNYLTGVDPARLAAVGQLLPESAPELSAIQDVAHVIADDGSLDAVMPGTVFRSGVRALTEQDIPPVTTAAVGESMVDLIDMTIDRSESGYRRNWSAFNRRRWERSEAEYRSFVEEAVRRYCDSDSDHVLALDDSESRVAFVNSLAQAIWQSPFENYSRFTGRKLRYKTGDEAIANIREGRGAICSEKVQALKFLTDQYGFESHYVFAGPDAPGPLPVDRLRHILDTFDFRGAAPAMRYWQHMALEFVIDRQRLLVDATNGNIPFLFMGGSHLLDVHDDKPSTPIRVKMGTYQEDFYYHRAPGDLARDLCYAMENFIPEIDLVQVFDNELGLTISGDFLVSPLPYTSTAEFDALRVLYHRLAEPDGLSIDVDADWGLGGAVGTAFQEREPAAAALVLDSYDHLLERYDKFEEGQHELGLAVLGLRPIQ